MNSIKTAAGLLACLMTAFAQADAGADIYTKGAQTRLRSHAPLVTGLTVWVWLPRDSPGLRV